MMLFGTRLENYWPQPRNNAEPCCNAALASTPADNPQLEILVAAPLQLKTVAETYFYSLFQASLEGFS